MRKAGQVVPDKVMATPSPPAQHVRPQFPENTRGAGKRNVMPANPQEAPIVAFTPPVEAQGPLRAGGADAGWNGPGW